MNISNARAMHNRQRQQHQAGADAQLLVYQCSLLKLPAPVFEHQFHPTRKWRFDVAWMDAKLAVEIDGGGWIQGRHSRGSGMEQDAEKNAEALLHGWRVFRCSPKQVKSGQTVAWLERAFRQVDSLPTKRKRQALNHG